MTASQLAIQSIARESVLKLKPYSSARDEFKGERDQLFLDANESPFSNGVNRYPHPQPPALLEKLSALRQVSSDNILIGNGSDEILDLLYRAFCEPGKDQVVYMPPTYGMYKVLAGINGVEPIELPLTADFNMPVEQLQQKVTAYGERLKLLLFCSPKNPTGHCFSEEEIEQLLKIFPGLVVIDEAYIDFSSQESWLTQLPNYPRLVVTQTFSKAWGMAGLRLGVAYAHQEVIGLLKRIKPPYNIDSLSQERASERLNNWGQIEEQIGLIKAERARLAESLVALSFVEQVYPSEANFLLIRVDHAARRYQELLEKKVVVRDRSKEQGCAHCLRITVGSPEENLKLLQALKEIEAL